ncbi:MAG: regulatory protein RecX, partial [Gaiellaceae bacterium]
SRRLRERLDARGIRAPAAEEALATLESAGIVDDARLARSRAAVLADRGWGDAAVAARLEQEGIGPEPAQAALSELLPEPERAAALATGAPDRRAAWRLLARRGFSSDSIEHAVGVLDENG